MHRISLCSGQLLEYATAIEPKGVAALVQVPGQQGIRVDSCLPWHTNWLEDGLVD